MKRMVRIRSVIPLEPFKVHLEFTDGSQKEVDLEPYLHGPIFNAIRNDRHKFRTIKVDKRMGCIHWDNGADIDPDVLYHELQPAWMVKNKLQGLYIRKD
jgi:hypothetical protein